MGRLPWLLAVLSMVFVGTYTRGVIAADDDVVFMQIVGPTEKVDSEGHLREQRYGPITRKDTLWNIASQHRPERSVSVYQTMVAIFQKNPGAFVDNNINQIANGVYLTLPSLDEVARVSHKDAVAKFSVDSRIWKGVTKPEPQATPAVMQPVAVPKTPVSTTISEPKPQAAVMAAPQGISKDDLESLRASLDKRIDELELLKLKELDVFRDQLDESSQELIGLAEVNHRLKIRMQEMSDDIAAIREDLALTRRNQAQILARLEEIDVKKAEATTGSSTDSGWLNELLSSPINLMLAAVIPVLLILLGLVWWMRMRSKRELQAQEADLAASTVELMDESEDSFSELFSGDLDDESIDLNDAFKQSDLSDDLDLTIQADDDRGSTDPNDLLEQALSDEEDDREKIFDDSGEFDLEPDVEAIDLNDDEMSALAAFEDNDEKDGDLVPSFDVLSPDEASDPNAAWQNPERGTEPQGAQGPALDLSPDGEFELDASDVLSQDDDDELSFEEALQQQESQMRGELDDVDEPELDLANIDLSDDDFSVDNEPEFNVDDLVIEQEMEPADLELPAADDDGIITDDMLAQLTAGAFSETAVHPEVPERSSVEGKEFVDIDKLLEESGDDDPADDPYDTPELNTGLDEFPELVTKDGEGVDVDINAAMSSKLDLARAYLEIDDTDGARKILQEVLEGDDEALRDEANKLMERLG
jgi:pilus assembly protein FimV